MEGQRQVERYIDYYNLDVIISVGYRVKSHRGTQFRIWAMGILKEYMKKGFALDDERLKRLGGGNYFDEQLARIRDTIFAAFFSMKQIYNLFYLVINIICFQDILLNIFVLYTSLEHILYQHT